PVGADGLEVWPGIAARVHGEENAEQDQRHGKILTSPKRQRGPSLATRTGHGVPETTFRFCFTVAGCSGPPSKVWEGRRRGSVHAGGTASWVDQTQARRRGSTRQSEQPSGIAWSLPLVAKRSLDRGPGGWGRVAWRE